MMLEAYVLTDAGRFRDRNEDAWLIDREQGIFVVADGMGGHAAGEVASAMAVESIRRTLVGKADPDETRLVRDVATEQDATEVLRERLRYAMNQASIQVRRAGDEHPDHRGMGTTVVVLVVDGDQAHLAHVGDSRAYLFREGRLTLLTRDHTIVQQEVDAGRLPAELARKLPHRNILTQSIGYGGVVEPDTTSRVVYPGDVFLLCSDGITEPLDDDSLRLILESTPLDQVCDRLVQAALDAGGTDNATALVVAVHG